jgi:hypothetical protein
VRLFPYLRDCTPIGIYGKRIKLQLQLQFPIYSGRITPQVQPLRLPVISFYNLLSTNRHNVQRMFNERIVSVFRGPAYFLAIEQHCYYLEGTSRPAYRTVTYTE